MASGDHSEGAPQIDPLVYARQRREWVGRVSGASFERLSTLAAVDQVSIELAFEIDEHDRVRMQGGGRTKARIVCQRCLEEVDVAVESSLDVRIMGSEQSANAAAKDYEVIVIDTRTLSVAELVEDDLILALPEVGCDIADVCPHRLPMTYPAAASTTSDDDQVRRDDHPFAALGKLKEELKGS